MRKNLCFVSCIFLVFAVLGCNIMQNQSAGSTDSKKMLKFRSDAYNFSFDYPFGWEETARDLPSKWAIVDKDKDTILFIVNPVQINDLMILGRSQALRDLHPNGEVSKLTKSELQKIVDIVKFEQFSNRTWYTYGMEFSSKNVDSFVSGTICHNNEIMLVLVSNIKEYSNNKELYENILKSFQC